MTSMCSTLCGSARPDIWLKGVSVADLTNAVREVVRGGSIIAPDVASKALQMFARMAKGNLTIGVGRKAD